MGVPAGVPTSLTSKWVQLEPAFLAPIASLDDMLTEVCCLHTSDSAADRVDDSLEPMGKSRSNGGVGGDMH